MPVPGVHTAVCAYAHFFGELSYPGDGESQYYKDDILVGYRWHDTNNIKPLFSFGHGLSYTTFKISNIKSDKKVYSNRDSVVISYKLKNIGLNNGAEVVQIYIGKSDSKIIRALKELKGFKKTYLLSGKESTQTITLDVADFSFYDESISDWNLLSGTYEVYVGNSSENISEIISINIK